MPSIKVINKILIFCKAWITEIERIKIGSLYLRYVFFLLFPTLFGNA